MRARGLNQPIEGIKAIAALAGGAIVYWLVVSITDVTLPWAAEHTPGGGGGVQMNTWFNTGLETILPAMFLLLVMFGLVAQGIFNSGGRFR